MFQNRNDNRRIVQINSAKYGLAGSQLQSKAIHIQNVTFKILKQLDVKNKSKSHLLQQDVYRYIQRNCKDHQLILSGLVLGQDTAERAQQKLKYSSLKVDFNKIKRCYQKI